MRKTLVEIEAKLSQMKDILSDDGFTIDGIFGSYARAEANDASDVDLLYHLEAKFFEKYRGFIGFKRLEEIKGYISDALGMPVDLVASNNLTRTGKKYILKDLVSV